MTPPFLEDRWFADLADRLAGSSVGGCPVALETTTVGEPVRHTMVIRDGYVVAWRRGWPPETEAFLRLDLAATIALCTGAMAVWNGTVPVELHVASADGTWWPRPLPPFDLTGLTLCQPLDRELRWAELLAASPFGNLDVLWHAEPTRIRQVVPRPADEEPALRQVARYHHVLEARAGRRAWLGVFEDGGWIEGGDAEVEQLIAVFGQVTEDPRYCLADAIADPLLALTDFVESGAAQIARLLELLPAEVPS